MVMRLRTLLLQSRQVIPVHRQNQIEFFEVCGLNLARAQLRQIVAASDRMLLGALIRWAVGVIVVRARGIC